MSETFDFVIIGAGLAGSVLANLLITSDATVRLLKAGGPVR
jgi:choline dehydrogenase-like flavoprotein